MANRALPDLVSRIRVDSSGVDQAIGSLIHSFGRADLALAGVAAGIGLLVVGGKSMIDIAEKHDAAERSLAQALESRSKATKTLLDPTINLGKYTKAAHDAARRLAEFDVANQGHKLTASQLMHRQDLLVKAEAATRALTAAVKDSHAAVYQAAINGQALNLFLDDFIKTNRRYISSQADVISGAAVLIRSGLSQSEVQKDLNRAVDLAALKHISLTDAVQLLNAAEHGRLRGLIDLGISTGKYTDAQGNLIRGSKDVGKAMGELDAKLKGGRETLTSLQQHSNTLSNDWQDLSNKGGPVLLILLDKVVGGVTAIYDWFDRLGKDDHLWATISDRLVSIAKWIHDWIIKPLADFGAWLNTDQQKAASAAASSAGRYGYGGAQNFSVADPNYSSSKPTPRAGGGSVVPNSVYSIGEGGMETLVMGPAGTGGYVIPNGGRSSRSGGDTYHFHQVMVDPWRVANEISWTKKTQRL